MKNRAEFNTLVKEQERMVIGEIKKIVPDINPADLQEVTQDVWLRAWEKMEQYADSAKAQTWLGTIARSVTKNWVRDETRLKRQQIVYEHDLPSLPEEDRTVPYYDAGAAPHAPSAEELCIASETDDVIEERVGELPDGQWLVWWHTTIGGYTPAETAKYLGITVGTVYNTLRQVRLKLSSGLD